MRRLLALLLLSTGLALASPPSLAGACSCVDLTPAEQAEAADVVVVGTLVDAEAEFPDDELNDAVPRTYYTFAVEQVYRGEAGATVEVVAQDDSPACGTSFDEGRHLIFATESEHSGDLVTSLCHGNEVLDDGAEVPAELGDGVAPAAAAPGSDEERATADDQEAGAPSTTWPPIGGPEGDVVDPGFLDTYGPALMVVGGVAMLGAVGTWVLVRRRRA